MKVEYDVSQTAWGKFESDLKDLALRQGVKKICDIGGGANPYLPLDFINQHGLDYTVLDISGEQLAKAPEGYKKLQADILDPNLKLENEYDLVFSKFLAEHTASGSLFHGNVLKILRDGGYAFHFFPTLYALPFFLNILIPEQFAEAILVSLNPKRVKEGNRGKFPAYYSWCRGPIKSQIKNFEDLGYSIEEYRGFFGHGYYNKIKIVADLNRWLSRQLVKHPLPLVTAYAQILLRKNVLTPEPDA